MRACYMEHQQTIEFLCEKDPTALRIKNSTGQTCMDLVSQSLNPLIANLLEKKFLETSSSDEIQMGSRKRVNYYYNGDNNKTTENNSFASSFENKETAVKEKMKKSISLKCNETDGVTHCKHHCQLDNSFPRYIYLNSQTFLSEYDVIIIYIYIIYIIIYMLIIL